MLVVETPARRVELDELVAHGHGKQRRLLASLERVSWAVGGRTAPRAGRGLIFGPTSTSRITAADFGGLGQLKRDAESVSSFGQAGRVEEGRRWWQRDERLRCKQKAEDDDDEARKEARKRVQKECREL